MNLLTGFILCNFPEESSFWILSCLTESIAPAYYVSSMQGLQKDIAVVNGVVADHLPTLLAHMDEVRWYCTPYIVVEDCVAKEQLIMYFCCVFVGSNIC